MYPEKEKNISYKKKLETFTQLKKIRIEDVV